MTRLLDDELLDILAGFPCNVLLILDCCHSGAVPNIQKMTVKKGLLVFAASRRDEEAAGGVEVGYSFLTLAVLEGLQNKFLYPADIKRKPPFDKQPGEAITLQDLRTHAAMRIKELAELANHRQSFKDFPDSDMAPQDIPITLQEPVGKH